MRSVYLGKEADTGGDVSIPKSAFSTHFHLLGGTGTGKTTAIQTIIRFLISDPLDRACFFIIDRLGGLSDELLLWMSSRHYCTEQVRGRLVYIQPSREDLVLPFNPLRFDTPAHGYFRVERATEIILRAWESVNIEAMPRLARWVYNAFAAAAQLKLTIADCAHFLMPGSPYHSALLNRLADVSPELQAEWDDIMKTRSSEAVRILESSRNRLKPYFASDILRRMFGSTRNHFDVERFMKQGSIVLLNLAPDNRIATQLGNTIGALVLNEILATARSLPRGVRYPTYVFLDEFQNFIGPDMEQALPEVRQLGLRLVLSHQSLSQLKRGDYDLTSMIFQAQSRLIFGVQGDDADVLAHELASIAYDSYQIKDEIYSRRQLAKGHRLVELANWSEGENSSRQSGHSTGESWSTNENEVRNVKSRYPTYGEGRGHSQSAGQNFRTSDGRSSSRGGSQSLVPEHENFLELSNRTFASFEEQKSTVAREIRNLSTGEALLRLVNDPKLYRVLVHRSVPGYLRHDLATLQRHFPQVLEDYERLLERNFESDLFVPAHVIDAEMKQRIEAVTSPTLQFSAQPRLPVQQRALPNKSGDKGVSGVDPFA